MVRLFCCAVTALLLARTRGGFHATALCIRMLLTKAESKANLKQCSIAN